MVKLWLVGPSAPPKISCNISNWLVTPLSGYQVFSSPGQSIGLVITKPFTEAFRPGLYPLKNSHTNVLHLKVHLEQFVNSPALACLSTGYANRFQLADCTAVQSDSLTQTQQSGATVEVVVTVVVLVLVQWLCINTQYKTVVTWPCRRISTGRQYD